MTADSAGEGCSPIRYSVVVPVYGNAETLNAVVDRLVAMDGDLGGGLEAVFVVDGSPDDSYQLLSKLLPGCGIPSQLVAHSRNFGSFAAIRTGFRHARGDYVAAMAADLQEPAELVHEFFLRLREGDVDVVVGARTKRQDPLLSSVMARLFWGTYRRTVHRAIPPGGVDIFGCTRAVAERLVSLEESHSSLVGLLYWIGYRRVEVPYERQERTSGKSGWSVRRKYRYFLDSVYSFSDLPITLLVLIGAAGSLLTVSVSLVTIVARIAGFIDVPGYTALMLVTLMSATSILLGLGVVGSYVWRTYENSKHRPTAIAMSHDVFTPGEN
ncbi:glycosyltransferase family 2 protein [Nocardioides sp. YIM 152315]|uniref:glycosyltransferase family 2 protein n=1 Tax=Nocardioides sp. YIM 152315 TaxID=3031760 RepID=UPI0023DAE9EE|nr:glycosyltransferase family 2 protein [Nocardioides sp. YIM 152315]MDF1604301.1 glycosyltransferase family 2 protein [Nocardioides sp. YIM 152315]